MDFSTGGNRATDLIEFVVKAEESWLNYHEGSNLGHTLSRHSGKSDIDLMRRLVGNERITGASSFTNDIVAESVISSTINSNRTVINTWLRDKSATSNLVLEYTGSDVIGRVLCKKIEE
ncbi:hypothetical protein OF897_06070 [Chryseobacterium formosus]|uniref:Bacterial CdiA-CT RNAse A domain-containing protein n=1 Tax=Chryseobacterium formosus TaxID=1537363 RepID=A0ABT3XQ63_9FLAO|nr:RNase A-like domain-containing protein [Chryseobacterium formosus]MCX8523483.1 hypothetical protein [Chryseobacterium formosus]